MEEYLVPTKDAVTEFTEQRSRFIGQLFVTETEQDALARIRAVREKHFDARHNVYAYIIRSGAMRYSDDGEPQGTAGMPVLEVLRREGLNNVCCVVTRYFGGILLGAGGLMRAYVRSAKDAVDAAGISENRVWTRVAIVCPYALHDRLRQEMPAYESVIENIGYGAEIEMQTLVPAHRTAAFLERVVDLSGGTVRGVVTGEAYRAIPIKKEKE